MKYRSLARPLLLIFLLASLLLAVMPALAQQNLLNNGNFEQAHGDGMTLSAPPGWQVSSNAGSGLVGRQLRRGQEVVSNAGIYEGNGSFDAYKGWSAYDISLYQTVGGIQPGSDLQLSAFGRMWSCDSDAAQTIDPCITGDGNVVAQTNTNATFRVGIDPTGSNDPHSPSIVWSTPAAPYTGFQQMVVNAQASGGSVTVVLNAQMQVPVRHQHVFWDGASLTLTSGSVTTGDAQTGAQPAAPVVSAVAAEVAPQAPRADGAIVHVVRPGDTLAGIAVAYEIDIGELLAANGLDWQSARILSPGQELIVRPASRGTGRASNAADAAAEGDAESTGEEGSPDESAQASALEPTVRPIEEYEPAPVAEAAVPIAFLRNVTTGRVCSVLFEDANPNRLQESGEGLLAGGTIALVNQGGATIDSHTTDGQNEPHCVDNLEPGRYMVMAAAPQGYGITTADTFSVNVVPGETVDVVFGAASGFVPPRPQAASGSLFSDRPGQETDTRSTGPLGTLWDYAGVFVLGLAAVVLVAGGVATLILRR